MKLIITDDDCGEDWVTVYHPDVALRAMALADARGWDPERRFAYPNVPLGEIWYTQDLEINMTFDDIMWSCAVIVEELLA